MVEIDWNIENKSFANYLPNKLEEGIVPTLI
jgi:hypothetical protein